jgi:branched-subunit amino acid aminotransferase/4-amino-4-deoxychorismate lyase
MFTAADLADADRILVCNALRGAVPAVLKVG